MYGCPLKASPFLFIVFRADHDHHEIGMFVVKLLDDLIKAINEHECPRSDADKLVKDAERVKITLFYFRCNEEQKDSIVGSVRRAIRTLPNRFESNDQAALYKHVSKLNPVQENLSNEPTVDKIENHLKDTQSLQALVFECRKETADDKGVELSGEWYLGRSRGKLLPNFQVDTIFNEYGDENSLPNLLALYALAGEAQINGNAPFAIEYLKVAYASAICKIKEIADKEKEEREPLEERIRTMGDPNELRNLQQDLKAIAVKAQRSRKPVVTTRNAIKHTLAEALGKEPHIPKCPDQ